MLHIAPITVTKMKPNSPERWQHNHEFHLDSEQREVATYKVLLLTGGAMAFEIAAGIAFGSMALLADGWHMGTHATAFAVTLFAYRYARAHADDPEYSFGTGKVSVLGGFASAVALAFVALLMAGESLHRLFVPRDIRFDAALVVAVLGLGVNLWSALLLHRQHREHGEHDHNIRSAYLHVITDALTSVLAIVALGFGKYLGWIWMDPLMGIVGSALIMRWSLHLVRDSGRILLDASADEQTRRRIREAIESESDNVMTDLHVWRVGPNDYAAIISLGTSDPRPADHYKHLIRSIEGISHVSVEVNVLKGGAATRRS